MAVVQDTSGAAGLDEALAEIVERTAELVGADVVVARLGDEAGGLTARAVHATSPALQAELEGSRISAGSVPAEEHGAGPPAAAGAPARCRAAGRGGGPAVAGSRSGRRDRVARADATSRSPSTSASARSRALQRTRSRLRDEAYGSGDGLVSARPAGALAGDALAADSDETRAADQVAALACEATGSRACLLWRYEPDGPVLAALAGPAGTARTAVALEAVQRAQAQAGPIEVERLGDGGALATLQLGQPPLGALQLLFDTEPIRRSRARAARNLRRSRRARVARERLAPHPRGRA